MNDSNFLRAIEQHAPLLADGAMGTMLHSKGISFEECFDALNLDAPAIVAEIHRAYIDSGTNIITTNTFGANRYKLAEHGLEDKLVAINCAGVELAHKVVEAAFKDVIIAGDVGPLGVRLAPYGRVHLKEARNAYAEQIQAMCSCGLDFILIETISDLYEIREAVLAAREVCDLPVLASMTFTRDDRTLLGDTPVIVARELVEAGADVVGINCSGGPAQLLRILKQMRAAVPDAKYSVMPNAGWPEQVGGRIRYPAGPDYFGEYALAFRSAGAVVIGGCCGTTPEHIAAMRSALDAPRQTHEYFQETNSVVDVVDLQAVDQESSKLAHRLKDNKFSIAVEMDPPRGLSTHKLLAGASLLADSGADVINVADSPMARMRMSPWAVCELISRKVGIETTLHFPTRGRNLLRVQGDLLAAHALGLRNIFVVMGDPTAIGDYPEAMDNYDLVPSGLIKLIKQKFNLGIDHAGVDIGTPTNFFVGAALNLIPNTLAREIKVLHRKVENGADFFLTQPIYEENKAREFVEHVRGEYSDFGRPILVGILPLYSVRHAAFLHNEVPGIDIPEKIMKRITYAGTEAAREGIEIAVELIEEIKSWASGIYLMPPFNRWDLAVEIIEAVKEDDC
jgi:homocysteine S-methyltransferase